MTNPPQGPPQSGGHNEPSPWAPPPAQVPVPPPADHTAYIPRVDDPTVAAGPQAAPPQPPVEAKKESALRRFITDPLSIVLIFVIIIALSIAGLLGGELYARKRANSVVSQVVSCVVQDQATASFSFVPPFLWQHLNSSYTDISVETAGNQIRDAKGMKLNLSIKDVKLEKTGDSAGTIGSLIANVSWSSAGIKQTLQDAIPLFGGIVSGVTTDKSAGTLELTGPLGKVIAKPTVVNHGISMEVQEVSGLGFTLPRETVQPALDLFTAQLTKNYPMGIQADSVSVTDDGVQTQLSASNATIPRGEEDPCFANV
ncbi:MAG: DUF2993 domain-containing protein [Mycobacterium sp.]|nr:DUF2993 domain-containing protein [Mycobacterium sp.]